MITSWHTLTNYASTLHATLSSPAYEGVRTRPYLDTKGLPTIGAGFNLADATVRTAVLKAIDVDPTIAGLSPAAVQREAGYVGVLSALLQQPFSSNDALRRQLDVIMVQRAKDHELQTYGYITSRTSFMLSKDPANDEVKLAFDSIIQTYETRVDTWLRLDPKTRQLDPRGKKGTGVFSHDPLDGGKRGRESFLMILWAAREAEV